MGIIEDFISKLSIDIGDGDDPGSSPQSQGKRVELDGILLGHGEGELVFGHLGHRFVMREDDLENISETSAAIPNPFGKGVPVCLHVKPSARLRPAGSILAMQMVGGEPFAIARPSEIGDIDYPYHTPNELAWLVDNGIATDTAVATSTTSGTYCGHNTQSPKWSGTNSNGRQDDGKSDEYYGDDATHDDQGADD